MGVRVAYGIAWVTVWLLAGSCCLTPTQLLVEIDLEPVTLARSRTLHVTVRSEGMNGRIRLDQMVRIGEGDGEVSLPHVLPISPLDGDATRVVYVEIEPLDAAGDRTNVPWRGVLGFAECERHERLAKLYDECIDAPCDETETCRSDGECISIPTPAAPAESRSDPLGWCGASYCFENPRPDNLQLLAACVDGDGGGFVAGQHGRVFRRAGGRWLLEEAPGTGTVQGLACWPGGEAVAVGTGGLLWERRDGTWAVGPAITGETLTAVAASSPDDIWAVGANGTALHRGADGEWASVDTGLSVELQSVWVPEPGQPHVAGGGRTLARFDGSAWTAVDVPGGPDRYVDVGGRDAAELLVSDGSLVWALEDGAWVSSLNTAEGIGDMAAGGGWLMATGGRGVVAIRGPMMEWRTVEPNFAGGSNLAASAVFAGQAIVASTRGDIGFYDGERVRQESVSAVGGALRDVRLDPDDPTHAVAVGSRGLAFRRRAGIWQRRVVGDGEDLIDVPDLSAVWLGRHLYVAVGASGLVAESVAGRSGIGEVWTRIDSGVSVRLHDVAGRDDQVLAAGEAGTLLERHDDGTWSPVAHPIDAAETLTQIALTPDRTVVGTTSGAVWIGAEGSWRMAGTVDAAVAELVAAGDDVWIAAGSAYVLQPDDTIRPVEGPFSTLADVGVVENQAAWAISGRSLHRRRDDGTYGTVTEMNLNALVATPDGGCLAVGEAGLILRVMP